MDGWYSGIMCGICSLFSFLHSIIFSRFIYVVCVGILCLNIPLYTYILIYLRWWTCWLFVCFVYCSTTVASNIQIYAFNGLVIIGSWQDFAQNYLTLLLNGYRSAFAVVTIITISFQGFYYYYYSCPNQCKTIIHCGIGLHLRTGTFIYAKRLF